jgi:hypothetical protein
MATITLKYNARNQMAQKTLDYVLSLGIFERKTGLDDTLENVARGRFATDRASQKPGGSLRKALKEVDRGEVIHCGSYENYLRMTGGNA